MRNGLTFTLVFVKNDYQILLGLKKRGLGKGKWNGFGGKVEKGETIPEGAVREMKEESNLHVENLNYVGIVAYEEKQHAKVDYVHVFTTSKFKNTLLETDEMKPQWFDIRNIPFQQMWPDGKLWFPLMLQEKYFFAHVIYGNEDLYEESRIKELDSFNSLLHSLKTFQDSNITKL